MSKKVKTQSGKRRILRKLCYALAGIIMAFILFVVLAPTILSLNPVRRMILAKAQGAMEGPISIRSWSFGWLSGIAMEDIEFNDGKGVDVRIRQISMSSGLIKLVRRTMDVGSIRVIEPDLSISLEKLSLEEEKPPAAMKPSLLDRLLRLGLNIRGLFTVKDARMVIRTEGGMHPLQVEKLNVDLAVEDLYNPLVLDFSASQGEKAGSIRGKVSVKILEKTEFDPQNISGDINLDIRAWDIVPMSEVAAYFARLPQARGTLNCQVSGNIRSLEDADTKGRIELDSLVLTNGPLGKDTPSFATVRLDFDVRREGRGLEIKTFDLDAPVARITASGRLRDEGEKYPSGAIFLNGQVDAAGILSELPHTLKMKEGLRMAGGQVVFRADIESPGEGMELAASVEVSDIRGSQGGQAFTLDSPVSLSAKAIITEKGPKIEDLTLSSSFANASGHGSLDDFELSISVFLDKTTQELGKFINLGKLRAGGEMIASTRITSQDKYNRRWNLDIVSRNISLQGLTARPVREKLIKATLGGLLVVSEEGKPQDMRDIAAAFQSSAMLANVEIQHLAIAQEKGEPLLRNIAAKVTVALDRAAELARDTGVMKTGLDAGGRLEVDCRGNMEKGRLDLSSLVAEMTDMVIVADGKRLYDPSFVMKTAAKANPSARQVTVKDMTLRFSAGEMMIPTATVHDWKNLPSGLDCTGSINVALEKLASFLSAFNLIPKGSKVSGLARCDFKVLPDKEAQAVVMDLALSKLAFTSRTGKVFQEQAGRLGVDASITMAEGNLVLNSLQIDTSPLNLKCSGTLTDLKKKRDLALKGRLEPDFARIAEIITVITGKHWDIEGKRPEDFFIRTSLSEKTWSAILQKTDALADLYVKRLKAFGVEGSDIMTKLVVKDSQAQANLETKVNEGDLKIVPVVDLRGKRPVLEVADNSRILNQVNLTDEMASELLALIHPIFKGSAIAGGRVGMLLKHCRVPLDETMKKGTDISGEVNLKGVELMPSGLLKAILGIAKIESARATISDQTISFLCRDGRIESSPLTLKAEGHQIILSGYMTLEGMVNYAAEVPVTEKMVSQDIYKYVKDARLKLLIEGPVSKPSISRKSMDETLESLVKEAAKNLIMEKGTDLFKQLLKKH